MLDKRARLARAMAEEAEEIASEGVTDLPTADELLVVERFYEGGE